MDKSLSLKAHLRPAPISACALVLLLQPYKIGIRIQLMLCFISNRKILLPLLEALQQGSLDANKNTNPADKEASKRTTSTYVHDAELHLQLHKRADA